MIRTVRASRCRKARTVDAKAVADGLAALRKDLEAGQGKGFGFLVGESSSPTRRRVLGELRKKLPVRQVVHLRGAGSRIPREAADQFFGPGVRPVTDFCKARTVLALDADFLGMEKESGAAVAAFADARKPENAQGRVRKAWPAFTWRKPRSP